MRNAWPLKELGLGQFGQQEIRVFGSGVGLIELTLNHPNGHAHLLGMVWGEETAQAKGHRSEQTRGLVGTAQLDQHVFDDGRGLWAHQGVHPRICVLVPTLKDPLRPSLKARSSLRGDLGLPNASACEHHALDPVWMVDRKGLCHHRAKGVATKAHPAQLQSTKKVPESVGIVVFIGVLGHERIAQPITWRIPCDDVEVLGQLRELESKVSAVGTNAMQENDGWSVPWTSLHVGKAVPKVQRSGDVWDA